MFNTMTSPTSLRRQSLMRQAQVAANTRRAKLKRLNAIVQQVAVTMLLNSLEPTRRKNKISHKGK
jgi:hypothetical protein